MKTKLFIFKRGQNITNPTMNDQNSVVYVRVPGRRPSGFQDAAPFEWNTEKETQLWQFLSKLDNSIDQIDWVDLSEILNAPVYFIKKRSYKLFTKQVDSMKRQIETKRKILSRDELPLDGQDETQAELKEAIRNDKASQNELETAPLKPVGNSTKSIPRNIFKDSRFESSDSSSDVATSSGTDTHIETLQHLRSSKILHMQPDNFQNGENAPASGSERESNSKTFIHDKISPLERQLERLNTQNSDSNSDISSSSSVSRSALGEALMDRLRF